MPIIFSVDPIPELDIGYSEIAKTILELKALSPEQRKHGYALLVPEIPDWVFFDETTSESANEVSTFAPNIGSGLWKRLGTRGDAEATAISASRLTSNFIAGETINALKVIKKNSSDLAIVANPLLTDESPIGLSLTAGNVEQIISTLIQGEVTDSNWNWTPGALLFLGIAGTLTSTPPTNGSLVRVGIAVTPQKIFFRIEPTLNLE